jgi:hypothetical protein
MNAKILRSIFPQTNKGGRVGGCLLLAPSVTTGAHMAFPDLRADRAYHQPGYDSRP